MKKTYSANIDGQIFNIDEDAFELLGNYLNQLRQTFSGNEGAEIVGDIESRIRELFNERIESGARVIVIADVNNVIETMGHPEDLSDNSDNNEKKEDINSSFISFNLPGKKHIYRNMRNKVFGGVFGGLASYMGWNANIMRLLYFIMACFTYFWPLTILYLIAWMIIPAATTPRQILEMTGEPVNVNTVGHTVLATSPYADKRVASDNNNNFLVTLFTAIGKTILILAGLLVGVISFAFICAFFCILAGMVAYTFFDSVQILSNIDLIPTHPGGWTQIWAILCLVLGFAVLSGLMAFGAFAEVFNLRGSTKAGVITTIIISVMLFAAAAILFIFAA